MRFLKEHKPTVVQAKPERQSDPQRPSERLHPATSAAHQLLNMQTTQGNQAVRRHLAQGTAQVQRWAEPGEGSSQGGMPAGYGTTPLTLSGKSWYYEFPTSVSTDDLVGSFKTSTEKFLAALTAAGATYQINATYRPPQRAYLMHYAYAIARNGMNPASIPAYSGKGSPVAIDWVHRDAKGKVDRAASKAAAEEMVKAYEMAYTAALQSRHTEGHAIDIEISWDGDLSIQDANGRTVVIKTTPRDGAENKKLHAVGKTYGLVKHPTDRPHWSTDGF
jgi:hypothetical protein